VYSDQGYSLARITATSQGQPGGVVELTVSQKAPSRGSERCNFFKQGGVSATNDAGRNRSVAKPKPWVYQEISNEPGEIFSTADTRGRQSSALRHRPVRRWSR